MHATHMSTRVADLCVVLWWCATAVQVSAPFAGGAGGQACVVMCVTDDEVNHIVLEGILQSQNYRSARSTRCFAPTASHLPSACKLSCLRCV